MTKGTVNGSGKGARSGARILALLANPLNAAVLRSLSAGPRRQVDLRRESGSPAQSTLRAHLKGLEEVGAIAKHRRDAFPGSLDYELSRPGEELLFVAAVLNRWLATAPQGALALGDDAARAAIGALAAGWSSTILRALAAGPLTLTELDRLIGALSYPSLERRLGAMRLAGLVESAPGNRTGTPYVVTGWLRQGIAPIVAAVRWERRNAPAQTAPPDRLDAEAGALLALPLVRLAAPLSGSCRIAVDLDADGAMDPPAAITATLCDGRVASCAARADDEAGAWIGGPLTAWLRATIEADTSRLELSGDRGLARAVLDGLAEALFGVGARRHAAR